jgi:hypothetical protein
MPALRQARRHLCSNREARSGSRAASATLALVERGTARGLPFFVSRSLTTGPVMSAPDTLTISPNRMAVSTARVIQGPRAGSVAATRSSSPGSGLRSRAGLWRGRRRLATGFATATPPITGRGAVDLADDGESVPDGARRPTLCQPGVAPDGQVSCRDGGKGTGGERVPAPSGDPVSFLLGALLQGGDFGRVAGKRFGEGHRGCSAGPGGYGLANRRLQPLGHPSAGRLLLLKRAIGVNRTPQVRHVGRADASLKRRRGL